MKYYSPKKQSTFNTAVAQMERISNLLIMANRSMALNSWNIWFKSLANIYKEISSKLNKDEKIVALEIQNRIAKLLIGENNKNLQGYLQFNSVSDAKLSSMLYEYDCYLRHLLDSHKFSSPDEEDPSRAVLESE